MNASPDPGNVANFTVFLGSLAALFFVSFSNRLQRLWLPLPLLALAWGALLGPHALGWVRPEFFPHDEVFMRETTRLILAVALMAIALRLPHGFWREHGRFVTLLLTLGMVTMWLSASAIILLVSGGGLLVALLLGAIMTPTDPVVSSPIVTGPVARASVAPFQRLGISAESGANDGLGLLFVLLPISLIHHGTGGDGWTHWIIDGLIKEIAVAVVVGGVCGWLASKMFAVMRRMDEVRSTAYLAFTLIFPIVVLTLARLLGADGILAAFLAGIVYSRGESSKRAEEEEETQEAVNKLAMVFFFILVGVHLPIPAWGAELGWAGMAGWGAALVLRRAVPILLFQRWLHPNMIGAERLFLAWFAPVGAAAVYYCFLSQHELERHDLWVPVSFVIALSVLLHGATATPLTLWLRRRRVARGALAEG